MKTARPANWTIFRCWIWARSGHGLEVRAFCVHRSAMSCATSPWQSSCSADSKVVVEEGLGQGVEEEKALER